MSGAIKKVTPNYALFIPRFDSPNWAASMERNFDILDAAIFASSGLGNIVGVWDNAVTYADGDRVYDSDNFTLWQSTQDHVSAATGTFLEDRTARPTLWNAISSKNVYRGLWQSGVQYLPNEFVSTLDGRYGVCVDKFISGATYDADETAGKIITLIDLRSVIADATASKNAAKTSETNAKASETAALGYRNNASASAIASANSATNAATSASTTNTHKNAAATSASNSATSATQSANSASDSAASALAAETAETGAQASVVSAAASATSAGTSATNAANSATAAATSETNAKTSETNSATSATSANNSKNAAATSASNAATSETNAATSASTAVSAKDTAVSASSSASTSASNASTSATNASGSATAANNSANTATTQANRAEAEADRAEQAASSVGDPVSYNPQTPTTAQQAQARTNIGVQPVNASTVGAALATPTPSETITDSDRLSGLEPTGTDLKLFRFSAVKTWIQSWLTKAMVGLGNVANKSEAQLVASGAVADAVNSKVSKSGDTMSGALVAAGVETSNGSLTVKNDGYSHLWLRNAAGAEKAVIFCNNAGETVTFRVNGAQQFSFQANGSFVAPANIAAYSDERLKNDIVSLTNALEIVCKLRGTRYIKGGEAQIGFIAQEVRNVVPEAVFENTSHDDQFLATGHSYGTLSVAADNTLLAFVVEAVKELAAEVKELRERVK